MEVIDISSLTNPRMMTSVAMTHPHGLGVDGNTLFVCEGDHGLKVFNVADPTRPALVRHFTDIGYIL